MRLTRRAQARRQLKAGCILSLFPTHAILAVASLFCNVQPAFAYPLTTYANATLHHHSARLASRSVGGPGSLDSYIVVLKADVDMSAHLQWLADAMAANGGPPTPPDDYPGGKDYKPPASPQAPSPPMPPSSPPAADAPSPAPASPAPGDASPPAASPPTDAPPSAPPADGAPAAAPADGAPAPAPADGPPAPAPADGTPASAPASGGAAPADGAAPGATPPSSGADAPTGDAPAAAPPSPPASAPAAPAAPVAPPPAPADAPLTNDAPTFGNPLYNDVGSPLYHVAGPYAPQWGNPSALDTESDDYLVPGPSWPGYGNPEYAVPGSPGFLKPAFPVATDGSDILDDPYDDPGMPGYRRAHPAYDGPTDTTDGAASGVAAAYPSLNIYVGTFVGCILAAISANPQVSAVVPDDDIFIANQAVPASEASPPWHLARISQHALLPKRLPAFRYNATAGKGVDIYIIDTGCYAAHKDLSGRVISQQSFPAGWPVMDGAGHGTHIAGLAAGTKYGVAKLSNIVCIKAFSDGGAGSVSRVISGIHYAIKRRKKVKKRPSIILISAAGPANAGLDAALRAAVSKGMHVVVAAGNGAQDSGSTSPAREAAVISVGASNIQDKIAPFSNVGPGVTLFAPGVDIESSWIGSSALSAVLSGTSMAAPLVVGVLATHISTFGNAPPRVWRDRLIESATKDVISGLPDGTANRLLYNVWQNASDYNTTRCWNPLFSPNRTAWNISCIPFWNATNATASARPRRHRRAQHGGLVHVDLDAPPMARSRGSWRRTYGHERSSWWRWS